jgi:WD repeat-containing protein 42A
MGSTFRTCSSLFCVERFELLCKLDEHQGCVNGLHFNESGTKLVTGSDDLNIIIWNWLKAKPNKTASDGGMLFTLGAFRVC